MKIPATLVGAAAVIVLALAGPSFSQGQQQNISLMKVDTQSVASGHRTTKLVGSAVVNEAGQGIGMIDDLIVSANDRVLFAVLSVGGFIGVGTKLVVVSYDNLEIVDKKMVLRGATAESLKGLPEFKYATTN